MLTCDITSHVAAEFLWLSQHMLKHNVKECSVHLGQPFMMASCLIRDRLLALHHIAGSKVMGACLWSASVDVLSFISLPT